MAGRLLIALMLCAPALAAGPPPLLGLDAHGGPLPDGAVARLGTLRWGGPPAVSGGEAQVAVSPDGKAIFCCTGAGLVVWRRADGARLPGPPGAGSVRRFHLIAGTSRVLLLRHGGRRGPDTKAGTACTWPGWRGETRLRAFASLGAFTTKACFSPDGKRAVLIGNAAALVDVEGTGAPARLGPRGVAVASAAFSPDGKSVAVSYVERGPALYSAEDGRALSRPRAARATCRREGASCFFSPDGSCLFEWRPGVDVVVRVCLRTGRESRRRVVGARRAALSPDGARLFLVGRARAHALDAATLRSVWTASLARELSPLAVGLSPDGKGLLVVTDVGLCVLNAANGKPRPRAEGHAGPVRHVAFSPDGRWLASGGDDGAVLLWDVACRRLVRAFEGHAGGVASLAFSPDGRFLAVGEGATTEHGTDRMANVRLWRVETGKLCWRVGAHLDRVGSLAFFRAGKALASTGPDERVRWWSAADGKRLGEDRFCLSPRLLPGGDGKFAFYHEQHGSRHLWQLGEGETPTRLRLPEGAEGPPTLVRGGRVAVVRAGRARAFMPFPFVFPPRWEFLRGDEYPAERVTRYSDDGELIAAASHPSRPGLVELHEVRSGRGLGERKGHAGEVLALAFSKDGRWLASAGRDGVVLLWEVDRARLQASLDEWLGEAGRGLSHLPDRGAGRLVEALCAAARAEKELPGLVTRLQADSFETRERATEELRRMGPTALPAMLRATKPGIDLEVRERLRRLCDRFSAEARRRAGQEWVTDAVRAIRRAGAEKALGEAREMARAGDSVVARQVGEALKTID